MWTQETALGSDGTASYCKDQATRKRKNQVNCDGSAYYRCF